MSHLKKNIFPEIKRNKKENNKKHTYVKYLQNWYKYVQVIIVLVGP